MGVLNDLLIPIENYDEIEIEQVIEKANKLEVSCIVLPEKYRKINSKRCLSLTNKEFIVIANKIEWLLRNGVFILLGDDEVTNNKIFDIMSSGNFKTYKKIWCCKSSTMIISKNRTVNESLNCRSCNLENI